MGKIELYGNGNGNGDGNIYGYGDGNGNGEGDGDGDGYGNGNGYGDGDGNGDGEGYGEGYGDGHSFVAHATPFAAYYCAPRSLMLPRKHGGVKPRIEPGLILAWDAPVKLCRAGLHASLTQDAARSFCPDGIMTEVLCSGLMRLSANKIVCQRRETVRILEED